MNRMISFFNQHLVLRLVLRMAVDFNRVVCNNEINFPTTDAYLCLKRDVEFLQSPSKNSLSFCKMFCCEICSHLHDSLRRRTSSEISCPGLSRTRKATRIR